MLTIKSGLAERALRRRSPSWCQRKTSGMFTSSRPLTTILSGGDEAEEDPGLLSGWRQTVLGVNSMIRWFISKINNTLKPRFNESEGTKDFVLYGRGLLLQGIFTKK
jgi:hypothetical protein